MACRADAIENARARSSPSGTADLIPTTIRPCSLSRQSAGTTATGTAARATTPAVVVPASSRSAPRRVSLPSTMSSPVAAAAASSATREPRPSNDSNLRSGAPERASATARSRMRSPELRRSSMSRPAAGQRPPSGRGVDVTCTSRTVRFRVRASRTAYRTAPALRSLPSTATTTGAGCWVVLMTDLLLLLGALRSSSPAVPCPDCRHCHVLCRVDGLQLTGLSPRAAAAQTLGRARRRRARWAGRPAHGGRTGSSPGRRAPAPEHPRPQGSLRSWPPA